MDLVAQYLRAGRAAIDLIAGEAVGRRWLEPSVLPGYRVGGLAAHLGRSLMTVDTYLDAEAPPAHAPRVDAAGYFVAALGDHDPVDSDFHAAVRARGEAAADAGQRALVAELEAVLARLAAHRLDVDQPMAVLGGTVMTLGEYLRTRLVELAVHTVDLADSVGAPAPDLGTSVWRIVAAVLADIAARRHDPRAVALGLARSDRYPAVPAL